MTLRGTHRLLSRRWSGLAILAAVTLLAPILFPSDFYYRIGALIFIAAVAVVGLDILMGMAGQVSLGHAGFVGIGAYTMAIGPARFGLPPWLCVGIALVLAGVIAWVVGRPILRLKGHYLAVATLGFGLLVAMVLTNEARWTGGPDGITVQRLSLFGWRLAGSQTWYWVSAGVLLFGVWVALNIDASPTGRALRALHDSEVAASVNAIDVASYKLFAFVVSAVYASLSGAMLALFNAFVTPDAAGFLHSIELVTMAVLGGLGSIYGAILGAALLRALPQVLTVFEGLEHLMLGLIMMLVMILMREGLLPAIAGRIERWRR